MAVKVSEASLHQYRWQLRKCKGKGGRHHKLMGQWKPLGLSHVSCWYISYTIPTTHDLIGYVVSARGLGAIDLNLAGMEKRQPTESG